MTLSNRSSRPVSNSKRDVGDGKRRGRRQTREKVVDGLADGRMHDRFEIASRGCIAEHDVTQARAIQRAVRRQDGWPKRATTAASPGVPGATTSRASTSASTTGTPASRIAAGNVTLAGRNPPGQRNFFHSRSECRAWMPRSVLRASGVRPARIAFCRRDRVAQDHRDRQRADAARDRRQRAGHLVDFGMHVADEDAALFCEGPPLARCFEERNVARPPPRVNTLMPTSITVAPGLTKSRVTKPAGRRLRPEYPPTPPCAAGRPCANDRS